MAHHALSAPSSADLRPHRESGGKNRASSPSATARGSKANFTPQDAVEFCVGRFLRSFQALCVASRLYQKNHPLSNAALETVELHLRAALERVSPIAIGLENDVLVFTPAKNIDPVPLEVNAAWTGLVDNWKRRGIRTLLFLPQTNLGELDALSRLLNLPRNLSDSEWSARLAEYRILGIRVNVPLRQRPTAALATLVSVLVAHPGAKFVTHHLDSPIAPPAFEDLSASLRLLARLEPIVGTSAENNSQRVAESIHIAVLDAESRTIHQLVRSMSKHAPRDCEPGDKYLARISECLLLETLTAQFLAGRLAVSDLRGVFLSLSEALVRAADANAEQNNRSDFSGSLDAALSRAARALIPGLPELTAAAAESCAERLHVNFWDELPPREKSAALRGHEAWCVPLSVLRRYVDQLLSAGRSSHGSAPIRESRILLSNYGRALESEESRARRTSTNGLIELLPVIEDLWLEESPVELDRSAVRALIAEVSPGIAGMLAALVENLARLSVMRNDFAEFERILTALEDTPRDSEHSHLSALAERLMIETNWQLLLDKALLPNPAKPARSHGATDLALARLLARDPERLLSALGSTLNAHGGLDDLPAMARLVIAAGEPVLGALQSHLNDPRRHRTATAIKLLAATEPQRLVNSLPRALAAWDWTLQDLAVAELTRRDANAKPSGVASAFVELLPDAHPLVVPVMLDEIGISGENSAVPLLCKIASGSLEQLRDVFIRIKAIEALGSLRASESADLLRTLLRQRQGLVHTEPAGLRAAAVEALALIENHPASARLRASHDALTKSNISHARPRRYFRIPLDRPYTARIESRAESRAGLPAETGMSLRAKKGLAAAAARVSSISLGGAFIESSRRFAVGDHIRVDIRAGIRHIRSTAVVRNVSASGGGVEFLHMPDVDRERLRRLVRRLLA
jgi:PilZ domain-containing protein